LDIYKNDVISILCPTRARPDNVKRLVESILSNAEKPELLEILFYVDKDDSTFPKEVEVWQGVTVFRGPKVWISNAHNYLYVQSKGSILFSAGDDMIFQTRGWDNLVREKFQQIPDGIGLVFGNDLGSHAGKIATHGFFHRNWVDVLGTWVQPGRGSLWDMWSTENARLLKRLFYLENLVIEHRHYRQSSTNVTFDNTYARIRTSNASFRPEKTYKKLARERRVDRILLAQQMSEPPVIELSYILSSLFVKNNKIIKNRELSLRLATLNNFQMILFFPSYILRKLLIVLGVKK
jgi:hypothetical protein